VERYRFVLHPQFQKTGWPPSFHCSAQLGPLASSVTAPAIPGGLLSSSARFRFAGSPLHFFQNGTCLKKLTNNATIRRQSQFKLETPSLIQKLYPRLLISIRLPQAFAPQPQLLSIYASRVLVVFQSML